LILKKMYQYSTVIATTAAAATVCGHTSRTGT
jgi:hypothetical protein